MGTFGSYTGKMNISEEKKEEFASHLQKLLLYGGMMQFDKVSIFGKKIMLINPVEPDQDGSLHFHYNYFEDDAWESAGYKRDDTYFFSGKIGGNEFCDVVTAVHFLYEVYDASMGAAEINGEIVNDPGYLGWINHILGTDFSMKKRFRLWELFEKHCLERQEQGEEDVASSFQVWDALPHFLYQAAGGTEFSDLCYVTRGTGTLCREELVPGSYPEAVYRCKESLQQYFTSNGTEEEVQKIWGLAKSKRNIREKMKGQGISAVAQMSLKLPARVLVYLTCEIKELDFWAEWKELYQDVYRDECMPEYTSRELAVKRKKAIEEPVGEISTAEFLYNNGPFLFWNTPEELKGKPNYYLSDDDRAFWWDGSQEVVLSKEMEQWLQELSQRHQKLMAAVSPETVGKEGFLGKMVSLLAEIEDDYQRVFCFQDMFYEFLQNGTDRRYLAAVRLLEELAEENKEQAKIIQRVGSWDLANRNVTHNPGRITMKRYLSVMANQALREKYFGF